MQGLLQQRGFRFLKTFLKIFSGYTSDVQDKFLMLICNCLILCAASLVVIWLDFLLYKTLWNLWKCNMHSLWVSLCSLEAGPLSLDNLVCLLHPLSLVMSLGGDKWAIITHPGISRLHESRAIGAIWCLPRISRIPRIPRNPAQFPRNPGIFSQIVWLIFGSWRLITKFFFEFFLWNIHEGEFWQ